MNMFENLTGGLFFCKHRYDMWISDSETPSTIRHDAHVVFISQREIGGSTAPWNTNHNPPNRSESMKKAAVRSGNGVRTHRIKSTQLPALSGSNSSVNGHQIEWFYKCKNKLGQTTAFLLTTQMFLEKTFFLEKHVLFNEILYL